MEIRVALVGVGNCASSIVQGVSLAKERGTAELIGVLHPRIGPYAIEDIEFVGAFDVDGRKVGRDLADAITAPPNCTTKFLEVAPLGVTVSRGPRLDGVAAHLAGAMVATDGDDGLDTANEAIETLKDARPDVVVNYLPGGSRSASEFYAGAAVEAGAAFVNCNPDPIVHAQRWPDRFREAGLPLLGDDIKSQFGTTATHRALLEACAARGAVVDRTYQLAFGGNTDFLNMRDRERFQSKLRTKESSLNFTGSNKPEIALVPPEYLEFLDDRKLAYIRLEGRCFLGAKFDMELRMTVEDSPNSAGVVIDAIRAAKLARDRGLSGTIDDACGPLFKSPPTPTDEAHAISSFEAFIGDARTTRTTVDDAD